MGARREITLIAIGCALLCIALAWASRTTLNPDGVSYLDISARFQAGDFAAASQGYWSPLYPLILAAIRSVTRASPAVFLAQVHFLHAAIAMGAIALLWRLALHHGDPIFARGLFAAFLLANGRAPRLDAVTPDLLLLGAVVGLGAELLVPGGRRWQRLGLWLGVIYLVKTSTWPWLLAAAVTFFLLGGTEMRRTVTRATALACAVMLLWIVPMSIKAGGPTLGSTGRLSACWYLERCDSRTPDVHAGAHIRVGSLTLQDGERVALADLSGTPWTYLPWSDPTAWEAGVLTRTRVPLDGPELLRFWGQQVWFVLSLWTFHLLVAVMLPMGFLMWRRGTLRDGWRNQRPALLVLLVGLLGVLQFVAVHAEPRLIAPFVLLAAMGSLWWLCPPGGKLPAHRVAPWLVLVLSSLGLATAIPRGIMHVVELSGRSRDDIRRWQKLLAAADQSLPGGRSGLIGRNVVVIGPAIPITAESWLFQAPIVAQIPPTSADRIRGWSPDRQRELLTLLGRGPGEIAWLTKLDGSFQIAPIPRGPP